MSLTVYIVNKCDCCHSNQVHFDKNITGNLVPMWKKAGVLDALYDSHGKAPHEIADVLHSGIADMVYKQSEYEELNPPNGWGDYESALQFLKSYYWACMKHSYYSIIEVSR